MNDPFFDDINDMHNVIVEKCKNAIVNERVYPFVSHTEEDRDINYRPFTNAIELTNETIISDDDSVSYIIKNLNTEWALSTVEQLCDMYKDVTLYRIYTHTPYSYKVIVDCKHRLSGTANRFTQKVTNKENIEKIHTFLHILSRWTLSMIWAAETEGNTYISENIMRCYFIIVSELLENA